MHRVVCRCSFIMHFSFQYVNHYIDVIMTKMAPQITSLTVVYSIAYSGADQRKHQSSASLAFVRGIHRDRGIPRTKGQWRGKCFHLMTSSWYSSVYIGVTVLYQSFTGSEAVSFVTWRIFNILWPKQKHGRYSRDGNLTCATLQKYFPVLLHISMMFVTKGATDNKPVLIEVMAWYRTGERPSLQ